MMVFHGNTLPVNTHLILWFKVQSRLMVMSKPMCPATDTGASLRIQVIKKSLPRVDSVVIEPMKVLKMFCWKHRVKNAFAKF